MYYCISEMTLLLEDPKLVAINLEHIENLNSTIELSHT